MTHLRRKFDTNKINNVELLDFKLIIEQQKFNANQPRTSNV